MTTGMELAGLIERGLTMPNVRECHTQWMFREDSDIYHVCALGLALVGKYESAEEAYKQFKRESHVNESFPLEFLNKLLDISFNMTFAIDSAHCQGTSSTQIINNLRCGLYI